MTDRNFWSSVARVLTQELNIFRDCAMDRERVVALIVALLFLMVAIRKAQRFRFLALYLVFERRQCEITKVKKKERSFFFLYTRQQAFPLFVPTLVQGSFCCLGNAIPRHRWR